MPKRRMKEALAGEPKRALGAALAPARTLGIVAVNEAFEGAHRAMSKVYAHRKRERAEEITKAKIRTRKVQAKDVDKFLHGALAARAEQAKRRK